MMHLRDRLLRLQEEGKPVVLFFGPHHESYLARLLRVGNDFIEFEALADDDIVIAHNILPLGLLAGVTVSSIERQRKHLEEVLQRHPEEGSDPKLNR